MPADARSGKLITTERLAIEGGAPVRAALLPYGRQLIDDADIGAVVEALRSDWLTQGPRIPAFEEAVAAHCGARYGVAFANGTAALHAACAAAGLGPGDEAITSPLTFAATANAVLYCGATPVLADVQSHTLTIDPDEIRRRITARTKAILPVDFAGLPADLDEINSIADRHGLVVIEDAAHSLGAEYRGRRVGSLAHMTMLSFHPVKHITTGEGGMILTDDPVLRQRLHDFRHHGIVRGADRLGRDEGGWYYEVAELGHNFRLTDFQCALGLSQLQKVDGWIERRRQIARRYRAAFGSCDALELADEPRDRQSSHHIFVLQLRLDRLTCSRRHFFDAMRAENIGVNVHYVPVHYHPVYRERFGFRVGDYPRTEAYYERALTLPIFPGMSDQDVDDVTKAVNRIVRACRRA